jgi:transposase-like protein
MPRGSNYQKPYGPEFRREAVELYWRSGRSLVEIAPSCAAKVFGLVAKRVERLMRTAELSGSHAAARVRRSASTAEDNRAGRGRPRP